MHAVMSAIMYLLYSLYNHLKHVKRYLHSQLKWNKLHKTCKKSFRHSTRNHSNERNDMEKPIPMHAQLADCAIFSAHL